MRASTLALLTLTALTPAVFSAAGEETRLPAHRYTTYPDTSGGAIAPGVPDAPQQVGKNRLIVHKTGAQSETSIAVDPTDARHLLASSNDLSNFSSFNNVVESFDGGKTWVTGVNSSSKFGGRIDCPQEARSNRSALG